ncbi:MAG: response regulator [Phycisphaerales bacterium]
MMMAERFGHADPHALKGLRVLIVEDDFLTARWLAAHLEEWGCSVVGPASSAEEGERIVETKPLDAALLDVNLRGIHSGSIADALDKRGVPFLFVTGYASPRILPNHLLARPRLYKPLDERELLSAMLQRITGEEGDPHPPETL